MGQNNAGPLFFSFCFSVFAFARLIFLVAALSGRFALSFLFLSFGSFFCALAPGRSGAEVAAKIINGQIKRRRLFWADLSWPFIFFLHL